jgi:hypothetical protein
LEYIPYERWLISVSVESEPVKSMVAQLKALGLNETNYVNAISQIASQMEYAHRPDKFAFETMVDWKADCDGFCAFVASILIASGYEVVLLFYREAHHEQIAVHLETKPSQTSEHYPIYWLDYKGIRYYPLECAGQNPNWSYNYWRVGMLPKDFVDEFKTVWVYSA